MFSPQSQTSLTESHHASISEHGMIVLRGVVSVTGSSNWLRTALRHLQAPENHGHRPHSEWGAACLRTEDRIRVPSDCHLLVAAAPSQPQVIHMETVPQPNFLIQLSRNTLCDVQWECRRSHVLSHSRDGPLDLGIQRAWKLFGADYKTDCGEIFC